MAKQYGCGSKPKESFGDDPPKVVYFKGFWDVHRGTGVLTHCHIMVQKRVRFSWSC